MQLAPLQLTDYFVHSIQVEAAPGFDSSRDTDLDIDALEVEQDCAPIGTGDDRRFAVQMTIRQQLVEGMNIPYSYEIRLVGFIEVHPKFPEAKVLRAVEVNGPSMLFGAAREILRAATGRGPYGPVLIPSATFYTLPPVPGKSSKPPDEKPVARLPGKKASTSRKRA